MRERGDRGAADHLAIADIDPNNLEEAGWCVVFAKDADPAVKKALEPLLDASRERKPSGCSRSSRAAGFLPGDDARKWIERQGAGFAVVDPEHGVPVYVLLVGSPAEIPFEFQYLLDLYLERRPPALRHAWGVPRPTRRASWPTRRPRRCRTRSAPPIFTVKNDGDRATGLLHNQVAEADRDRSPSVRTLASFKGFQLTPLLGENATKERLTRLLSGKEGGGPPAFLFTGSHGVKFKMDDPQQREKQGAILCQDWPGFGTVAPEHLFTAADVPADAKVHGLIHFLFACYGGGCPEDDNFGLAAGQPPKQLMKAPIVARLPQRLLTGRAGVACPRRSRVGLFVPEQPQRPAGAGDARRDGAHSSGPAHRPGHRQLQHALGGPLGGTAGVAEPARVVRRGVGLERAAGQSLRARNDARNYIIIGDPAVPPRTESMTE